MDINKLNSNDDEARNGKWFDWRGNVSFKIREARASGYSAHQAKQTQRRRARRLSLEQTDQMAAEACAKFLVADWKGFTEGGVDVPCTEETRARVFAMEGPAADDMRAFILEQSNEPANWTGLDDEAVASAVASVGNGSSGTSDGESS